MPRSAAGADDPFRPINASDPAIGSATARQMIEQISNIEEQRRVIFPFVADRNMPMEERVYYGDQIKTLRQHQAAVRSEFMRFQENRNLEKYGTMVRAYWQLLKSSHATR